MAPTTTESYEPCKAIYEADGKHYTPDKKLETHVD